MKEFQTYAVDISDDLKDIGGGSYQAWTGAVLFIALHFINDL